MTIVSDFLELDIRRKIYDCIKGSPGIHFREVQRRVGVATGSADYHLHFLVKQGLLRAERTGRFLRYYVSDTAYEQSEKELLDILRHKPFRHIIIYLMEKNKTNALKIAEDLGYSPSSLSWSLKYLMEKDIIKHNKKGRFRFYSIKNNECRKMIIKCLLAHKESFLDRLVDNFISAWAEE